MPIDVSQLQYVKNDHKIILLVIGGLGGVQWGPNMLTELQQAHKPNLNALARKSLCGLLDIIAPGIIPEANCGLDFILSYHDKNKTVLFKSRLNACLITDKISHQKFSSLGIEIYEYPSDLTAGLSVLENIYHKYDFLCFYSTCLEVAARTKEYYEKVKAIEELDTYIPKVIKLSPQVLSVTGDRSLPSSLGKESWHPVPVMIHSQNGRYDYVQTFDEIACIQGGLGILPASALLSILLAEADKVMPIATYPQE